MINHPRKPSRIWPINEIKERLHSGNYEAEFLLMHLCHKFDEQSALLSNLTSIHKGATERWKNESPVRVDFAGRVDGGDMALTFDKYDQTDFAIAISPESKCRKVEGSDFIRQIENSFFRTVSDTGANLNAMLIWNCVRRHAGLPNLKVSDLPYWDEKIGKFVEPKDSKLLRNLNP